VKYTPNRLMVALIVLTFMVAAPWSSAFGASKVAAKAESQAESPPREEEPSEFVPMVEEGPSKGVEVPRAGRAKTKGPDEEDFVDIKSAPPLVRSEESKYPSEGGLLGAYNDSNLLLLGLRTDTSYFAGSVLQQGFALSSVRLTAWGSSGNHVSYRFSMGQTREFSSVLLPQLTPVEAWVDVHTSTKGDWNARSRLNWRVGMFGPTFNPWWSPDLADMPVLIPDYLLSHKALFIARDLGTELTLEPIADKLSLTVGVFNGNGIFSYNTNASKAFTFNVQGKIPIRESHLWIGASGYLMDQADASSISFRSNGVWNLYAAWEYPRWKSWLAFEVFGGELNDSTRSAYPFGAAAMLQFRMFKGLRFYSRAESMRGTGRGGTNRLTNIQMGPVLDFHKTAQLFLLFNHNENEDGTNENFALFRLRVQI
jgi:hypothetical protein